jgi:hypothetical protein
MIILSTISVCVTLIHHDADPPYQPDSPCGFNAVTGLTQSCNSDYYILSRTRGDLSTLVRQLGVFWNHMTPMPRLYSNCTRTLTQLTHSPFNRDSLHSCRVSSQESFWYKRLSATLCPAFLSMPGVNGGN